MNGTRSGRPGDEHDDTSPPVVIEWVGDDPEAEESVPCAACGDAATHTLVLTVDWIDDLVDARRIERPDGVCRAPLCARCHSWAEMIEIAELDVESRGSDTRERVAEERARFLDYLDVRRVDGATTPEAASELR